MKKSFTTAGLLFTAFTLYSADIYVSPAGDDRNSGEQGAPKATLTSALRARCDVSPFRELSRE